MPRTQTTSVWTVRVQRRCEVGEIECIEEGERVPTSHRNASVRCDWPAAASGIISHGELYEWIDSMR